MSLILLLIKQTLVFKPNISFLLLEQLWSFNSKTGKIINKNGPWQYQNNTWTEIPSIGTPGPIEEISGNVLTLDSLTLGVVLSPPDGSESQLWTFGITFRDGYFTLRNPKSGGYLTATSETSTTAEGIITSDKILSNIYLKRHWPFLLDFLHLNRKN